MAKWRFRKSKKIAPGVRINLSRSGPSLSVGPKGAKVNISRKGTRTTVGIPGTGISRTKKGCFGYPLAVLPFIAILAGGLLLLVR